MLIDSIGEELDTGVTGANGNITLLVPRPGTC